MIRTNKDYTKRIKERLVEKNPELYGDISEYLIKQVVDYFTMNMVTILFGHKAVSVLNYLNIYPSPKQLYEYRMSVLTRKSVMDLQDVFDTKKKEIEKKENK